MNLRPKVRPSRLAVKRTDSYPDRRIWAASHSLARLKRATCRSYMTNPINGYFEIPCVECGAFQEIALEGYPMAAGTPRYGRNGMSSIARLEFQKLGNERWLRSRPMACIGARNERR